MESKNNDLNNIIVDPIGNSTTGELTSQGETETVQLVSSDSETFTVSLEVALMSATVKGMLENIQTGEEKDDIRSVPLPNITSTALTKVIEFCNHYLTEKMTPLQKPLKENNLRNLVQPYYADYVHELTVKAQAADAKGIDASIGDPETTPHLIDIINAAHYLDIKPLLDLTHAKLASFIKGKTKEQIREDYNIVVDMTPEECAQIEKECSWVKQK